MTDSALEFRVLPPGYATLGVVADFLTRGPPYDSFASGALMGALKSQIAEGHHIAALRGGKLVGYAGWLPIRSENGEDWLAGRAEFTAAPADSANAIAVTIVRAEETGVARVMMRRIREASGGRRAFFRKDYVGRPLERRAVGMFKAG